MHVILNALTPYNLGFGSDYGATPARYAVDGQKENTHGQGNPGLIISPYIGGPSGSYILHLE